MDGALQAEAQIEDGALHHLRREFGMHIDFIVINCLGKKGIDMMPFNFRYNVLLCKLLLWFHKARAGQDQGRQKTCHASRFVVLFPRLGQLAACIKVECHLPQTQLLHIVCHAFDCLQHSLEEAPISSSVS